MKAILRLLLLTGTTLLILSCNREVSAFEFIDGFHNDRVIELLDEGRRPQEEESIVLNDEEFRFSFAGGAVGIPEEAALAVEVQGLVSDGLLLLEYANGANRDWSFGDYYSRPGSSAPGETVTLVFPLPRDMEIEDLVFSTREGTYTIETIELLPRIDGLTLSEEHLLTTEPYRVEISEDGFLRTVGNIETDSTIPVIEYTCSAVGGFLSLRLSGNDGMDKVTFQTEVYPGKRRIHLHESQIGFPVSRIEFETVPEGFSVDWIGTVLKDDITELQPIPISLDGLIDYPQGGWRREDFELFAWELYPDILIVDTVSYAFQASMFKRAAFFLEKRGYSGSLLDEDVLSGLHGYNAHDYNGDGLALFFSALESSGLPWTIGERELVEIALRNGLIDKSDGGYTAGTGGFLSISRESGPDHRKLLLTHESMHGVFYEEPRFREEVFAFWDSGLDAREQDFWRELFSYLGYDPGDRYLMVNELQAYVLQQPSEAVQWYFGTLQVSRLIAARPYQEEALQLFLRDYPRTFQRTADFMNSLLMRETGLTGGKLLGTVVIGAE